jgi:hypothetical protein
MDSSQLARKLSDWDKNLSGGESADAQRFYFLQNANYYFKKFKTTHDFQLRDLACLNAEKARDMGDLSACGLLGSILESSIERSPEKLIYVLIHYLTAYCLVDRRFEKGVFRVMTKHGALLDHEKAQPYIERLNGDELGIFKAKLLEKVTDWNCLKLKKPLGEVLKKRNSLLSVMRLKTEESHTTESFFLGFDPDNDGQVAIRSLSIFCALRAIKFKKPIGVFRSISNRMDF